MKTMIKIDNSGKKSPSCLLLNPYLPLTLPLRAPKRMMYLFAVLAMLLLGGWNTQAWGRTYTWKVTVGVASGKGTAKAEIIKCPLIGSESSETSCSSTSSTTEDCSTSENNRWDWQNTNRRYKYTATASTGYTFAGWYTSTSVSGTASSTSNPLTGDKDNDGFDETRYAKFTPNKYTVKFDANGGSGSMSDMSFTYDEAQNLKANNFTKTGYTFSGWNTKADGKGNSYSNGASVSNLTSTNNGTVTLYAQWTANTYYVAFNGNGSTGGSMSNESFTYDAAAKALTANAYSRVYTVSYNADGGTTASTTAANTTATYTFNGWEDRNSIVYNGTTYSYTTFDAPYYANTYADLYTAFGYNKYSLIQHYVNNGKKESRSCKGDTPGLYPNKASVANMTTTAGGTVTLYANWTSASVTLPEATKTNSVIEGWYIGSTKVGVPGDSYTPTANVTLTAKWIDQYPFTMSGANYELLVGETKENAYTFTYAENPEVHISPSGIISYANGTITALSEGTATIYFTQASTSTIKEGESAHWTVKVSRYDNTLALNKNSATKYVGEEVTDVLKDASINSNAKIETSSTDATIAYYDVTNDKIVVDNSGNNSFTSTTVTIKIWQAQNVKYTASGEKTFTLTVNKIANTLDVTTKTHTMYVDEELAGIINSGVAIKNRNNNDVAVDVASTDADLLRYVLEGDKVIVPNDANETFVNKVVTLTFSQPETYKYTAASETIAVTVKKYVPTFALSKNTLELDQTATLSMTDVEGAGVTVEPATGVVTYADGAVRAVGLGSAKLTVMQPETRTHAYKKQEFDVAVIKKTPTLVVKMDGTATTSKSVSRGTVVNVAFEENSDADVVVTNVSGAQYASYINGVMTAGAVGTATYRASLAETDTYQAKSVDFSLTVTKAASNHVPFTIDTQSRYNALNVEGKSSGDHEWSNSNGVGIGETDSWTVGNWDDKYVTFKFEGVPDELTFDYIFVYRDNIANKMTATPPFGSTVDGQLYFIYVEESADGSTWSALMNDQSIDKDNWKSFAKSLKKTTRYIRFHLHADYGAWFRNIKVSELKYVETPDPSTIDFGSATINSGEVSKTSLINWCNIAPLSVICDNPRFTVTPVNFGNFDTYATQTLTVKYTHTNEAGTNEGDITISNGDATYTKTIHVTATTTKRPQTITWNSDLVATGYAMNVGEQYPDEVITPIATATSGGNITYKSDNTDVIEVIDGVVLSAVGTGKANITAYQAGDDDFDEVSDTKEFIVTELQKQVITWNQNLYGLLTTSGNVTLNATATSGMAITYESADKNVVRVEGNTLIVVGEGETYITASQAGGKDANDVEWLPISQNNYVIVRDPNSQCNGLALSLGSLTLNNNEREFALAGIPQTLTFTAKHGKKSAVWGTAPSYAPLIVEQFAYENNQWDWSVVYNKVTGTDNTASGNITLDESATKIRISTIESGTDYTINNIRVTRPKFMNSDVSKVDQEVETNALWQQTVTISHSNIDVMSITTKRGLLSLSTSSLGDGCEDFGEDQFVVSYTPMQKDAEYLDTIVITDSKAEPTTITIPIRLHTTGWNQEIENFNLPAAALTTDALPALTATATSELDVRYESSNKNIVRIVNGNELEIITSGTVTIKAIQDGNNRYYETYAEKSITISKAVPALVAPEGTDVTYLDALSTSLLSDGSATVTLRGAENTTVEGTFAWTNPAQQITDNVGVHSYSVTFTPNNTVYYAPATTTVEINVIAATSVATPSAANIVYGQKVSASLLSNVGTDGTWAWNTGNNEAVLDAGTHEGLAVHFTPSSTNYTELDATVTLTVAQADAEATPAITAITYGQKVSEAALTNAGATDGAWALVGVNADEVKGAGSYELNVHFTPTSSNYKEKDATVTLTVNKAASEATPSAAAIKEGQKVSESVLTNSGTAGTWVWDAAVADNTPAAGTYNYTVHFTPEDDLNYTELTTTVQLQVNALVYNFTNNKGDGNWSNPENWESGIVPTSDPDIIVTGALEINESITVGSLTIEQTGSVSVISGDTLTVNGVSEDRTAYGDLHVEAGGQVILGEGSLKVHDFILDASLGGLDAEENNQTAKSGQVTNAEKIEKQGNAYFDLSFDPSGKISYGWYDFTVPFEVNIAGGIYRIGSTDDRMMVSGTHFMIMEADEANRANGGKGWKNKNSGVLQPGKLYTITFNYSKSFDQNTFRFMWNGNGSLSNGETYNAQYAAGSDESLRGWNGMGNGMLRHGYPEGDYKMQVYNHSTNTYELVSGKKTFAVGSAFFVQVAEAGEIDWETAAATAERPLYAPRREAYEVEEFCLSLRQEDADAAADVLYFSASEEATEAYVIGHDLLKMGTPTDSKVARLWATKGGKKLCDVEAGLANNNAEAPLSIYAPQTGTYILSADEAPANTSLYLTYNGRVIWNLSYSPYTLDLTKGTTEGYGLKLYVNRITTDIEEVQGDGAQSTKVLMDNKIYIIMPNGAMYDATGKKVQ